MAPGPRLSWAAAEQRATAVADARMARAARWAHHDVRDGLGCLMATDSGIPPATAHPDGTRHQCACGRRWVLRDRAEFRAWYREDREGQGAPATVGEIARRRAGAA